LLPIRCYDLRLVVAAHLDPGEVAFTALYRASVAAGRSGIVVADQDFEALDQLFGSRARSRALVARLEKTGRARAVRRGAYILVDAAGNVRPTGLELVAALTPKPYLVTAGASLQFHDLTDQHFRLIIVLASTQRRNWKYRGQQVRYVRTGRKLAGSSIRSRRTPAAIAAPAIAIADSLDHPSWGVTLAQVAEAIDRMLHQSRDFPDRLASEVANHYGHALARRMGVLITALAGQDAARAFLPLRGRSKAAANLLAGGPDAGALDTTWGVRINVDLSIATQHRT
jgi:predicted transcriptional regulator of viral defense system